MFKIKLYEYNNDYPNKGYRGKEYTKYILQGSQFTEDITQVLDTSEITLSESGQNGASVAIMYGKRASALEE